LINEADSGKRKYYTTDSRHDSLLVGVAHQPQYRGRADLDFTAVNAQCPRRGGCRAAAPMIAPPALDAMDRLLAEQDSKPNLLRWLLERASHLASFGRGPPDHAGAMLGTRTDVTTFCT
jgi:hypothetical protein